MSQTVNDVAPQEPLILDDIPKAEHLNIVRPRNISIRKLSSTTTDTDNEADATADTTRTSITPDKPKQPLKVFGRKSSVTKAAKDTQKLEGLLDLLIFIWFLIAFKITVFIKARILDVFFFFTGLTWRFYAGVINIILDCLNMIEGIAYRVLCEVVNMSIGRFIPNFVKAWLFRNKDEDEDRQANSQEVEACKIIVKKALTLVLDLDETLIHSSRERPVKGDFAKFIVPSSKGTHHEFYLQKRPHLEEFLAEVSKEYNVIIFTAGRMDYANTAINMIENKKLISRRFFRESCYKTDAGWAKDLNRVDTDLNKVILVDNCKVAGSLQPENHILIKSWYNDENDICLLECKDQLIKIAERWRSENVVDKDLRQYIKVPLVVEMGEEISRN